MLRRTLNLGILAHVDAGKTTLTERLLYAAGVIDAPGSVDAGTTQTDTLALEQQRGITIKSAVVSFPVDDVTVNLIDTPGHPDFIAEVERVLGMLDGAVLVVSAVEGVQPQTRVLMRALRRLGIPSLIFVNKLDRAGADSQRVLGEIADRLTSAVVAVTTAAAEGTRTAAVRAPADEDAALAARLLDVLAEHDDELLADYVERESNVSAQRLRDALAAQTAQALVHPLFVGSAITGAGVDALRAGIAELLPAAAGDPEARVAGTVFKVERGPAGERIAYVRMFAGTIRTRDRLHFGDGRDAKVTALAVFDRGGAVQRPDARAGEIAKVWGLADVQIGDRIGDAPGRGARTQFPPPTLASVVAPVDPDDRRRLRVALGQLAEQDPLIDVRQDDARQELSVSLYGEVQKEVIQATLADDYGLEVAFRETMPIYVERPIGRGEALEALHAETNPFNATIGLRLEPAPADSGVELRLDVDPRDVPLYIYKTLAEFREHMDEYVRDTLREGLRGWRVTDCLVTLTRCNYSVADGPPSRRGPTSTAADFRKLTPLVLVQALERAGTVVCEPTVRATLEVPSEAIGAVLAALAQVGATFATPRPQGRLSMVEALLPAVQADVLQRQLPALTAGEGVLDSTFAGYAPVTGDQPVSPTTSSGRTGTRVNSRPVAARSAATTAAVDTTVGGSPTPLTP
jgi:ribosomal protection tetracycline resistance protein